LGDAPPPLDHIRAAIELNKMRARTLVDLVEQLLPFIVDDAAIAYDAEAVKKHLKGEDLVQRMTELHDALAKADPFDVETTELELRVLADLRGVSAAQYIHPPRLARTGAAAGTTTVHSPPPSRREPEMLP